uniref:Selenoprotein F/M domain-containing protein n=1 Tax=Ciona savignyi TaxID=51511 RepID=H2YI70_CIOSA
MASLGRRKETSIYAKILQLFFIGMLHSHAGAGLSPQECSELGFSSELMCGSCSLLPKFNLTSLEDNCKQCCQSEAEDDNAKRFPSAILEVCG